MEAAIIWIALIIIFAVVEIITVGLTSIWFAGGALVALLVDAAGLGPVWQFADICGSGHDAGIVGYYLCYRVWPNGGNISHGKPCADSVRNLWKP